MVRTPSPFLRYLFLTTKRNFLPLCISSRGATARSLFHGNLPRVLQLTRHDMRGEAEKPSYGAVERADEASRQTKGGLYGTLLNAFAPLRFTDHHFLQRCRFDSARRAQFEGRASFGSQANFRDFFELASREQN